jgi:hypothetical protein
VKVGLITTPGYRNSVTLVLTGGEIEAKAELAQRALWAAIPGGEKAFDEIDVRMLRADGPDPATPDAAVCLLTISVAGRDRAATGRLARAAVETGLSSYPGLYLTAPPGPGSSYTVFWPTLLPADRFPQRVVLDGREWAVQPGPSSPLTKTLSGGRQAAGPAPTGETARVPLGRVIGSRSGDKGGNATLGVWARDDRTFSWLAGWLTEDRWRELLPQAADLDLRTWWLPNIRAAGVTVVGLLGYGVAANLHLDSQGKGLGEYLRARHADVPRALLDGEGS